MTPDPGRKAMPVPQISISSPGSGAASLGRALAADDDVAVRQFLGRMIVADIADHLDQLAERRTHFVHRLAEILLQVLQRRFDLVDHRAQDDPRAFLE